jgi:hypothetical protein
LSIPDKDLADWPTGFLAGNREIGGPEQASDAAEQGMKEAHRRAAPRVDEGAACHAFAAVFATSGPASPSRVTGHGDQGP